MNMLYSILVALFSIKYIATLITKITATLPEIIVLQTFQRFPVPSSSGLYICPKNIFRLLWYVKLFCF